MSIASGATWQRIYHTTLYRFSREGHEEILHDFRESPDVKSATCIYDAENQHFEISCLSNDTEQAEQILAQLIGAFVQNEEDKADEFDNYERRATKFPQALVDEDNPFDDDVSEPGANFRDDDLIDLSTEPEKTTWTPSSFSLQLERCYPQSILDALSQATNCSLTLDSVNRRILIKPYSVSTDVQSVKRRLTNIEALYVHEIPVIHSLETSRQQDFHLSVHKLHEKAEKNAAFNGDGTLTRLLFPGDSPIFEVRDKSEPKGKILDKLSILRLYKVPPFPDPPAPLIVKPQSLRPSTGKPFSRLASNMKFRQMGPDTPNLTRRRIEQEVVEPAPERAIVEHWVDDVVESQPQAPPKAPSTGDTYEMEHAKTERARAQAQTRPRPARVKPAQTVIATQASEARKSNAEEKTWDTIEYTSSASQAWPTSKSTSQNVFATSTYAGNSSGMSSWSTPYSPSKAIKPAWGEPYRPENKRPDQMRPARQTKEFSPAKPPDRPAGKSSNAWTRPPQRPPQPKSVVSSNPFAQLGQQEDDEEEDSEGAYNSDDEVKEQLAQEDWTPVRVRLNRQRAPGPPPGLRYESNEVCQSYLKGICARGKTCRYKHDDQLKSAYSSSTPSRSDPSAQSSTATSLESSSEMLPIGTILKTIKSDDLKSRLTLGSFRNTLLNIYKSLERARALQGSLNVRVQVGKIVARQVPSEARKDITTSNFDSTLKHIPGLNTLDQTFTPALTTSGADMDSLLSSLGIDESTSPLYQSAYFELSCVRTDKSSTCIVIDAIEDDDQSAEPFAKSLQSLVGAWYHHHPTQAWDSRLVITNHGLYPLGNINGANTFLDNLSIRHENDKPGPGVAGRNEGGLFLQQARFITLTRWPLVTGWSSREDVYIEIKRVIDHPIFTFQADDPNDRGRFSAACLTEKQAIQDQRLWYEIDLGLVNPSSKLIQNEPYPHIVDPARPKSNHAEVDGLEHKLGSLELYEKADWKPEEVLTDRQLLALHEVAVKMVERMDGVGAKNRGYGALREADLKRIREKQLNAPDQFW